MKKVKLILFSLLTLLPFNVFAAGTATISGAKTVTNGSNATVNVTLKNTAAWNIKISGGGATSGCSKSFADVTDDGNNTTKTLSITCKATSLGLISFKVSGDITSSDGTNSNVSLNYSVKVVAPREKETESRLGSLSVTGYEIDFDKDKTEYSIIVPPTTTSITIDAKAMGTHATVSGIGTKEIDDDGGKYVITCTAENGLTKEYTINVSIIDENPINIKIDGKDYTVVKTNKSLKTPTNYKESTIKIEGFDIPAYTNAITKLTIIGVKDNNGNISYAIYNNNNYSMYNENKSADILLFISQKPLTGYKETTIIINAKEYQAYGLNDRAVIVYAMNINTGKYNYYKYDKIDNTFQYYEIDNKESNTSRVNGYVVSTIILSLISTLSIGYILYFTIGKKNRF